MQNLTHKLLAPLAFAVLCSASLAADKIPVTASFSILGDLVQVVGGERVAVTTLVGPDQDAHVFEPKPTDAKTILASKLVLTNGLGFEPWAHKLVKAAGYKGATVVASQGVKPRQLEEAKEEKGHGHAHSETDPHAWQNPVNVQQYVRNIATGLAKIDPAGASSYQANAEAYVKELQALDSWAQAQFAAIPPGKRKVITSHDAFGYFADHYQLQFLAPQGISTETEPSAKQVAQLIRQIQREKIKAVFVENMANPQLIAQLSKDAGVTLGADLYADALSAPGKPGASYLQMARYNVEQLVQGMRKN
jgi:zinc/manganese transport system substrate-binding protein